MEGPELLNHSSSTTPLTVPTTRTATTKVKGIIVGSLQGVGRGAGRVGWGGYLLHGFEQW